MHESRIWHAYLELLLSCREFYAFETLKSVCFGTEELVFEFNYSAGKVYPNARKL